MQSKIFIKWTLQKSLKNYYYFKLCLKVNYMKLNFLQNTWRPLSSTEAISVLYFKLNYLMIMFFAKKITTCFFCNRKEKFYHAKPPQNCVCLIFAKFAPGVHFCLREIFCQSTNFLKGEKSLHVQPNNLLWNSFWPTPFSSISTEISLRGQHKQENQSVNGIFSLWPGRCSTHESFILHNKGCLCSNATVKSSRRAWKIIKKKNFSCQSQLWGWFSHSRLQMREKK